MKCIPRTGRSSGSDSTPYAGGYRVGFICASDVHTGKPGASRPSAGTGMEAFGVRGGLGGIYAESLTRESLWEALKSRRCYGTTGDRIAVWFECNGRADGRRYFPG